MSNRGSRASSTKSASRAVKRLSKWLSELETVPYDQIVKSAEKIKNSAQAQVPYKSGKLQESIDTNIYGDTGRISLVVEASALSKRGYDYAGIQHENPSYNHLPGRKYHYISDPFNAEIPNLQRRIRRRLKKLK